jgi:predicted permease
MMIRLQIESAVQDLQYACRSLLRNPSFAVTALLAMALGTGAAVAVFSVVDPILFRRLPYADEDRLVSIGTLGPNHIDSHEFMFSRPYLTLPRLDTPFEAITSWSGILDCDLAERDAVRLNCARVESNFLATLGVRPLLGRDFSPDDDRPNAPGVTLVSFGLWQSRYGGDPGVLGRIVSLNENAVRVIGVLPADFELPTLVRADLLIPQVLVTTSAGDDPDNPGRGIWAFARLKPGIASKSAEAAWGPMLRQAWAFMPQAQGMLQPRLRLIRDRQTHDTRTAAWVLFGSVLSVLLIACANVANLLLARAARQQHERAVRSALGASRLRWIRGNLFESLLLGLGGGAAGCCLAYVLIRAFAGLAPDGIPRLQGAGLDYRILCFAFAVSVVSSVFFAVVPALQMPPPESLWGHRAAWRPRHRMRQLLIAAQFAISLVLLTGATLLSQTLWNLQNVPLGIRTKGLLTSGVTLNRQRYPDPARQDAFFSGVEERLRNTPGITAVAVADSLPPGTPPLSRPLYAVEVAGQPKFDDSTMIGWRYVSPEYFSLLAIPILRGRAFTPEDRDSDGNVIILSEALAQRLFPDQDPLAGRVDGRSVIGVAADVKNSDLSGPVHPEYYIVRPGAGNPGSRNINRGLRVGGSFIIESNMDTGALTAQVRKLIASADPMLPATMETLDQRASRLLDRPRFNASLVLLFAVIGLSLSAIGLYGLTAFLVEERTREIGIRVALGATPRMVIALVLSGTARWGVAGALAGSIASVYLSRYLQSLLFEVEPGDSLSLGIAAGVLLSAVLLAAAIPSRHATHIDPVVTLKHE